jgi:nucleoside-diphosphate-sugar epimerase
VEDLVAAIILLAERGEVSGKVFNIGSEEETSFLWDSSQ